MYAPRGNGFRKHRSISRNRRSLSLLLMMMWFLLFGIVDRFEARQSPTPSTESLNDSKSRLKIKVISMNVILVVSNMLKRLIVGAS
jgi:hypothetical protein